MFNNLNFHNYFIEDNKLVYRPDGHIPPSGTPDRSELDEKKLLEMLKKNADTLPKDEAIRKAHHRMVETLLEKNSKNSTS